MLSDRSIRMTLDLSWKLVNRGVMTGGSVTTQQYSPRAGPRVTSRSSAALPRTAHWSAGSLLTQGATRGSRLDVRPRLLLQVLLATAQQRRSVCCTRRRCHSPLGRSMTCRAAARVVFHSQIGCARSDGDRRGRSRPYRFPVRRSVILCARSSSTASATRPW